MTLRYVESHGSMDETTDRLSPSSQRFAFRCDGSESRTYSDRLDDTGP